jgi:hypothetical protein
MTADATMLMFSLGKTIAEPGAGDQCTDQNGDEHRVPAGE